MEREACVYLAKLAEQAERSVFLILCEIFLFIVFSW